MTDHTPTPDTARPTPEVLVDLVKLLVLPFVSDAEGNFHSIAIEEDGDGWNEPRSEAWTCECEAWDGPVWVQSDPACTGRPDPVAAAIEWRSHVLAALGQDDLAAARESIRTPDARQTTGSKPGGLESTPAPTEAPIDLRDLLERAWDAGNCVGLDGYEGPGRGAGEVDPEALQYRERDVEHLLAARTAPASEVAPTNAEAKALREAADVIEREGPTAQWLEAKVVGWLRQRADWIEADA